MAEVARKSIIIRKAINAGELLTLEHIMMKRPGTGLAGMQASRPERPRRP